MVKDLPVNAGDVGVVGSIPGLGKIPWRRKWYSSTPVFLPGKFHRQRSWQATVHGVAKSWTRLSVCVCARAHTHTHFAP